MAKTYKNIPVSPDTYQKIALLAEMNGFGPRGMGAQIEDWLKRELPECGHAKQAVSIEYFLDARQVRGGLYCPTCKRVYSAEGAEPAAPAAKPAFVQHKPKSKAAEKLEKNIDKAVAMAKAKANEKIHPDTMSGGNVRVRGLNGSKLG